MFASPSPSFPRTGSPRRLDLGTPEDASPERLVDLAVYHRQHGGDQPWRWLGRAKRCSATGPNLREVEAGEIGHIYLHAQRALPANYTGVRTRARVRVLPRGLGSGALALSESEVGFEEHEAASVHMSYGPLREAGNFLLAVTLEGGHIGGSPFPLRVLAGRASAGASELVGSDDGSALGRVVSSALAGRRTFFTALLRDEYGNRVLHGGHRVAVRFDVRVGTLSEGVDPSSARVACEVADNGDGSYTVAYTAPCAASYDATVTLDGAVVGGEPVHCLVLAAPTLARAATIAVRSGGGRGGERVGAAVAGQPSFFTLHARDEFGNRRDVGGDSWRVELRLRSSESPDAPIGAVVHGRVHDEGDGSYTVSAVPQWAGTYSVHAFAADGTPLAKSPLELVVLPGELDAGASRAYGASIAGEGLVAGEPGCVFVEPTDGLGNVAQQPDVLLRLLRLELTDSSGRPDSRAQAYARVNGGRIVCDVVASRAGSCLLHVSLGGVALRGSPFALRVRPGRPDARSSLLHHANWRCVAGERLQWALQAYDRFGNRCTEGGAAVELRARPADARAAAAVAAAGAGSGGIVRGAGAAEVRGAVSDRGDGSYGLEWTVTRAGVWAVHLTLDGQDVPAAAPARVLVEPAAASASMSCVEHGTRLAGATLQAGEWVAFLLVAKDRFGNPTMRGGDELAASCTSSLEPVLLHDWGDGRYELRFAPMLLGSHSIRVALPNGGGDVLGSPFAFLVEPGPASARQSSASGDALDGTPLVHGLGSLTIVARDALGNRRVRGGDPFAVTVVPRTHAHYGHVHAFVDRDDGCYEVAFTTALSGRYYVEVTLDGVHIAGSPFPVTTSAAAPAYLPRSPRSPRATHRPGSPPWPLRASPSAEEAWPVTPPRRSSDRGGSLRSSPKFARGLSLSASGAHSAQASTRFARQQQLHASATRRPPPRFSLSP